MNINTIISSPMSPAWIKPALVDLCFEDRDGKLRPAYVRDAHGFLIHCGPDGSAESFIPYSLHIVPDGSIMNPDLAETQGINIFAEHVEQALRTVQRTPEADAVEDVYLGFTIPILPYLFAAKCKEKMSGTDPELLIQEYQMLASVAEKSRASISPEIKKRSQAIRLALSEFGIFKIPPLDELGLIDRRYFDVSGNSEQFDQYLSKQISPGWYSHDNVWTKACYIVGCHHDHFRHQSISYSV